METLTDMIAGFLVGLTPGTRAQYRSVVSRWLRWCADNGIDMLRAKRTHIEASEALARLIGGRKRGAVFREDSGARLRQQTAVGIVSAVALRVGVPGISPHSLRRTFCTLSRDAGVPDRDIMAAGGWNSPQMLDYYDMSRRGLNGKAGDGLQRFLNNG